MEYADLARATSGRGEVVLRARHHEDGQRVLELRVNGVFVMDTAETRTERALAGHALQLVARPARILIGGLGLGFTAAAVLADARVEACTVVELEPAVVEWMREGTVPHGPALLADPRLRVVVADIAAVVQQETAPETAQGHPAYDVILLDVDNGPANLVHEANAALYGAEFLRRCARLLAPGGVLAVWAGEQAPALTASLAAVLTTAEARPYAVDLQGRAERYWLHVGRAATSTVGP